MSPHRNDCECLASVLTAEVSNEVQVGPMGDGEERLEEGLVESHRLRREIVVVFRVDGEVIEVVRHHYFSGIDTVVGWCREL